MTDKEQIEEIAKDICKGCQTRLTPTMKCNRNCCAMAEVVAEYLCNMGYKQEKEVAKEIFTKLLKRKNPQGIIYTFTKDFMQLAKEYGIELE